MQHFFKMVFAFSAQGEMQHFFLAIIRDTDNHERSGLLRAGFYYIDFALSLGLVNAKQ